MKNVEDVFSELLKDIEPINFSINYNECYNETISLINTLENTFKDHKYFSIQRHTYNGVNGIRLYKLYKNIFVYSTYIEYYPQRDAIGITNCFGENPINWNSKKVEDEHFFERKKIIEDLSIFESKLVSLLSKTWRDAEVGSNI